MLQQIGLERARAFVLAHADALGTARLGGILEGARPPKELVKALEAVQNPDGGFPCGWVQALGKPEPDGEGAVRPSSLDATCSLLDQLRDLPPLTGSPMASRALSYLRRSQNRDGSWWEEGAPVPGPEGAAYLTATVSFTLLTLDPSNRDPINWGLKWLEEYPGPWSQPTAFRTWGAACCHRGVDSPLAIRSWERAMSCGNGDLAGFLSTALIAGVGGRYLVDLHQLLSFLFDARQESDGGWPGPDRVEATLMALRIARGFDLII